MLPVYNTCTRFCTSVTLYLQVQQGTCLLSDITGSDIGSLYSGTEYHHETHNFEMKPILGISVYQYTIACNL